MAFGPAPAGLLYFVGVKLAGYSWAGSRINAYLSSTRPRPIVFGAARTALGLAAGVSFALFALRFGTGSKQLAFYAALLPVRIAEWLAVLWYFYRGAGLSRARTIGITAAGCAWSYLLDLPAIFAVFVIPGGAWVC